MKNEILITILCVTFNHYNYIRDALDSIFRQKVNFNYEIVVHDDASTDGTTDILREYEQKYPDKITVLYEVENQYQKSESFDKFLQDIMLPYVRGKYVLSFEGDDYWIDETKLQRQVDYLEKHCDCMMVTHNAAVLNVKSVKVDTLTKYYSDRDLLPEEIINHPKGYLASASMVMRRECYETEGFFHEAGIGDYTRQLYSLTKGKVHYIDRIMSVYRFAHSGSWQESQEKDFTLRFCGYLKMVRFLDKYNAYTDYIYTKYIMKEIQRYAAYIIGIFDKVNISEMLVNEVFDETYKYYINYIIKLYKQINDDYYLDDEIAKFIEKHKHILIMGAGKYASVLANQIRNSGRDFEGFVISSNRNAESLYMGKKVYKINEIPYNNQEIGLLVGINAIIWDEIESTLLTHEIRNYFCPYLFDSNHKIDDL